ncbi:hypothetical protein ACFWOB_36630 [Streptomyces sp. NPDC058420]|uniref:hypothetical protein n=1 Tax=Streptomyces sp. NPDC058420 TaxID=3346489 RepID=UPI00364DE574
MRRTFFTALLFGLLAAAIPAVPASAAGPPCDKDFPARLSCWTGALADATAVTTVTLNEPLDFDGAQQDRRAAVRQDLRNLQVQIPADVHTGQGGAVLLVLAGHRLVDPDARIDRLSAKTLQDLGSCNAVCQALKHSSLTGRQLIGKKVGVGDLGTHTLAIGEQDSTDYRRLLLYALTAVLVLLLVVLVLAVRRSRVPAEAAVGALSAERSGPEEPEETTARLRPVPPAPAPSSYGRRVGPRTGPSRTAVVRTALHPQGYVELDHVLYRAVWTEPDRTPPVPGAYVEVTDAHEPDSDVLYAFPPAARHHARGTS